MRGFVVVIRLLLFSSFSVPIESFVGGAAKIPTRRLGSKGVTSLEKDDKEVWPLALLLSAQMVLYTGVGAVIPTLPLYASEIGLSSKLTGVVISAPAAAMVVVSRASGGFADRSRKQSMMYGMALIAVADYWTAIANDLSTLVAARLALGLGRGVSEAGERGMLADLAGRVPRFRGRAVAAQQMVAALGIAAGSALGGIVVQAYGIRSSFLCVSVAALATLALYSPLPETSTPSTSTTATSADSTKRVWKNLLKNESWRRLCVCECGARFGFAAKLTSVPILASKVFDGSPVAAGLVLSIAAFSGLIAAPFGGYAIDRGDARTVAATAGIVGGIALALIPLTFIVDSDIAGPSFVALVSLWSAAVSCQGPALTSTAQLLCGDNEEDIAASLSLPRAVADASFIVAPFVLGAISDASSTVGLECAVAGLIAMFTSTALVLGDKRQSSIR